MRFTGANAPRERLSMPLSSHTMDSASSRVSGAEPKWSLKWIGGGLGVLIALADAFTLRWFGVDLNSQGYDVTLVVAGWFGVSFALLGVYARQSDRGSSSLAGCHR